MGQYPELSKYNRTMANRLTENNIVLIISSTVKQQLTLCQIILHVLNKK